MFSSDGRTLVQNVDFLYGVVNALSDVIQTHGLNLDADDLTLDGQADDIDQRLRSLPQPTGASRSLDSPFLVNATRPALCFYPITLGLGAVGALSKAYVTPTVGTITYDRVGIEQLLSVLVSPPTYTQMLALWVPAAAIVTLTTTIQNSGNVTLGTPIELVFG